MKKLFFLIIVAISFFSCGKSISGGANYGELVGVTAGRIWEEPAPNGMVLVARGSFNMGISESDSLWGESATAKGVSVEEFWMDQSEITNSKYKQFVHWVRDSIIRERLADPAYGGDEIYKISEDEMGEPIKPRLDWKQPIPWKRATEEEESAINSVQYTHPITGKKQLDASQMNYIYEWYDYTEAAKRMNRSNPYDRELNTDIDIDPSNVIMISKDTAYIKEDGTIVNETIVRPMSGLHDFLHTRIVNIYPDTTCWVNDFPNSFTEQYMRQYFSNPAFNEYPVVGVSWEQATAFCVWRTELLINSQKRMNRRDVEPYRLPTEAEWEYAARAGSSINIYPWNGNDLKDNKNCFMANFKPSEGGYAEDGYLVTAKVASFKPNDFGLFDMAGNVAEWTSSTYSESGLKTMNDVNPEYRYSSAKEDPYILKKKVIKGGSWKDISRYIRADMRTYDFQNVPRSYIGFRCVRSVSGKRK